MEEKKMTFAARCKTYFGMHTGETLTEFMNELKALTPGDKAELTSLFNAAGLPTEAPKS